MPRLSPLVLGLHVKRNHLTGWWLLEGDRHFPPLQISYDQEHKIENRPIHVPVESKGTSRS